MMRTLKRSSSLLSSGITASATLRPISCEERSPARSMMSSSGASPATVGSAIPPRSICPARSTRSSSGPLRLRSGQLASVTEMRPPERLGNSSRSIGMSTRVYCGMVGESCVTIWIATGGPAGSSCANAGPAARTLASAMIWRFIVIPLAAREARSRVHLRGSFNLAISHERAAIRQALPIRADVASVGQLAGQRRDLALSEAGAELAGERGRIVGRTVVAALRQKGHDLQALHARAHNTGRDAHQGGGGRIGDQQPSVLAPQRYAIAHRIKRELKIGNLGRTLGQASPLAGRV